MEKTGRVFKCKGLKKDRLMNWSNKFTIGSTYMEILHPQLSKYGESDNNYSIRLISDNGDPFWVDASQFYLVSK